MLLMLFFLEGMKFRQGWKQSDNLFKDLEVRIERFCNYWCDREDIDLDYKKLFDLI